MKEWRWKEWDKKLKSNSCFVILTFTNNSFLERRWYDMMVIICLTSYSLIDKTRIVAWENVCSVYVWVSLQRPMNFSFSFPFLFSFLLSARSNEIAIETKLILVWGKKMLENATCPIRCWLVLPHNPLFQWILDFWAHV